MSTVRSTKFVLQGAAYLIRMDVDLGNSHLQVRDIDLHVLVHAQNQDAAQLTTGENLVGEHDLEIEAFGDGRTTHRFLGIEFGGRLAIRTPRTKLALLKFRYRVQTGTDGTVQVGWADVTRGVSRIQALYPSKHAGGALYPQVHLEPGAAVHQINLTGPDSKAKGGGGRPATSTPALPGEDQQIAYDPRRLLSYLVEDHPEASTRGVWAVKLGLDSFRTNSCRWLAMIAQQDAHWRGNAAGHVADEIQPIDLTITNPNGTNALSLKEKKRELKIRLEDMAGGQLLYSEASGALAKPSGVLTVDDRQEDRWDLYDGADIQTGTLGPISLSHLGDLVPLTGRDLGLAGLKQGAAGPSVPPVERVTLKFVTPHFVDDEGKKIGAETDVRVALTSLLT